MLHGPKKVKAYIHSVGLSEKYYKPHIIDVHNSAVHTVTSIVEKITSFNILTMWTSTIELKQYIDTPMHLIFQVIVKSMIEFSFLLLTHCKKQMFLILCSKSKCYNSHFTALKSFQQTKTLMLPDGLQSIMLHYHNVLYMSYPTQHE